MAINVTVITGRLTKNPEVRKTNEGTSVCTFTVASDRNVNKDPNSKDQVTADFIQCVAWRQSAEYLYKYGRKGSKVAVNGRIQTGSYVNSEGRTVYTTNVAVQHLELAGYTSTGKQNETQQADVDPGRQSSVEPQTPPVQAKKPAFSQQSADRMNWDGDRDPEDPGISEDDLPF